MLIPIRLTLERFSFSKALEQMDESDFAELAKEVWLMGEAARDGDLLRWSRRTSASTSSCSRAPGSRTRRRSGGAIAPRIRAYFFRYGAQSPTSRSIARRARRAAARDADAATRRGDCAAVERHITVRTPAVARDASSLLASRTCAPGSLTEAGRSAPSTASTSSSTPAHARRRRRVGQRQVGHARSRSCGCSTQPGRIAGGQQHRLRGP